MFRPCRRPAKPGCNTWARERSAGWRSVLSIRGSGLCETLQGMYEDGKIATLRIFVDEVCRLAAAYGAVV